MPDTPFVIDREIQNGVYEIRNIGRRYHHVSRRAERLAGRQCAERLRDEVPVVAIAEERCGAHDERIGVRAQNQDLRVSLRATVFAQRTYSVGLDVGRTLSAVEYEVRRERYQLDADGLARAREGGGAIHVPFTARTSFVLCIVHAHEARTVDEAPRAERIDSARDGIGIRDVERSPRECDVLEPSRLTGASERAPQRP